MSLSLFLPTADAGRVAERLQVDWQLKDNFLLLLLRFVFALSLFIPENY